MEMKCDNCRWNHRCGLGGACLDWSPADLSLIRCETCLYCRIERHGLNEAVDCLSEGVPRETSRGLKCRHWRLQEREEATK
jgi:hypothetical protein